MCVFLCVYIQRCATCGVFWVMLMYMGYATVIAVYASTELKTTTTEAATDAEVFYTVLQSTVSNAQRMTKSSLSQTSTPMLEQTLISGVV